MSRNRQNNPFFDEDDDSKYGAAWGRNGIGSNLSEEEEYLERILEQKRASQNRQLDSCNRALSSIYSSEQIGISTAQELLHQGEQLDNVERKTEEIDQNLTVSQRHLNHVKSVFGGIKNWFTKGKEEPPPPAKVEKSSYLKDTVAFNDSDSYSGRVPDRDTGMTRAPAANYQSGADPYEEEFENYLGEMSSGIARLKGLGAGLQSEIEQQNDQLDRITGKVEKVDSRVGGQNQQMRKILK